MQTAKIPALVFGLALVTSACGDSMSSLNPTAPSALSPDSLNVEAGAMAASGAMANGPKPGNGNGNGNGNRGGNGNGNQPRTPSGSSLPAGLSRVQIEGLISAVDSDSVTVNGQLVTVTAATVIRHGDRHFVLAELKPGDRVHVTAARVVAVSGAVNTGAATLEATEIKLQNPGESDGEEPPAPTGLVSVAPLDNAGSEVAGETASFRFTRTGDLTLLSAPLTVTFVLSGTATNGTDYQNVGPTVTFLANQPTVDLMITPVADTQAEGMESVVLTLSNASPYELGSPVAATVTISDPPEAVVTVMAVDDTATEAGDFGILQFTRTGNLSAGLTVTLQYSGSAVNGMDYDLPPTVVFQPGSATASMIVFANPDGPEAAETLTVTVVDAAGYNPGSPSSATVTITDF